MAFNQLIKNESVRTLTQHAEPVTSLLLPRSMARARHLAPSGSSAGGGPSGGAAELSYPG
eukprot:COSAG02_NODE_3472_length_6684_cov_7.837661_2_plen_60_part_00